jgi:hypothetical protein
MNIIIDLTGIEGENSLIILLQNKWKSLQKGENKKGERKRRKIEGRKGRGKKANWWYKYGDISMVIKKIYDKIYIH